ncbi:hypothetical protein F5Y17DRAFT_463419 [Xylariaceae sp. FL0594]|nr:hypothetical protein F5Y17DRAFT_463419 [Xylariaceae sp. FL0594]
MKTCNIFVTASAAFISLCAASAPANAIFAAAPDPVQNGHSEVCYSWLVATEGMTCSELVELTGIASLDQFYALNPQLGGDCQKIFWAGYHYCINDPNT